MRLGSLDHRVERRFHDATRLYGTYGVRLNAVSVEDLFALYEETGFLYPGKAARLVPYLSRVKENWNRMLGGGDSLISVLTAGDEEQGWASLVMWRNTVNSWVLQHLVSDNNPFASRAVMLASGANSIQRGHLAGQNWFRPENRFPARVFGSMAEAVGKSHCSVHRRNYFVMPKDTLLTHAPGVRIVPYDPSHARNFCALAATLGGAVYFKAEEFADDSELKGVDELYKRVGLHRSRRVWLAYNKSNGELLGAAIAHRGPLGINFSYLENRCDLLFNSNLSQSAMADVAGALLRASQELYEHFELEEIPLIAHEKATQALVNLGAEFLRTYCQGIWLKDGFSSFYRHIDSFYGRLLARAEKHALQHSITGSSWA
jgi:hypothetical protein